MAERLQKAIRKIGGWGGEVEEIKSTDSLDILDSHARTHTHTHTRSSKYSQI